jgi:hypothetical protein
VPYTLLAFAGVSGVTLKVVARCQPPEGLAKDDKEGYFAYLTDAQNSAVRLYGALTDCEVFVKEQSLKVGCRMSHDPQLYYQPEALPLPVVREEQDILKAYEDTQADDEGNVLPSPSPEVREQAQLEYHTCLSKAIEEAGDHVEHCVQQLADYCAKAHLGEEDSVERTRWQSRFRTLSEDVIRKIFRNAYKKPQGGKPLSQMN